MDCEPTQVVWGVTERLNEGTVGVGELANTEPPRMIPVIITEVTKKIAKKSFLLLSIRCKLVK